MDTLRFDDPLSADWVTALLLALLFTVAWLDLLAPGRWRSFLVGAVGMGAARPGIVVDPDRQERFFMLPVLIALVSTALFLWQLDSCTGRDGPLGFPIWLACVAVALVVHLVITRVLGFVFRDTGILAGHVQAGLQLFVVAGLLLLPVVVLTAYRAEWRGVLPMVGAAVLAGSLLHRWVRGVRAGWGGGIPLRFIMIYLCAAEILPVLLLVQALRPPVHTLFNS